MQCHKMFLKFSKGFAEAKVGGRRMMNGVHELANSPQTQNEVGNGGTSCSSERSNVKQVGDYVSLIHKGDSLRNGNLEEDISL